MLQRVKRLLPTVLWLVCLSVNAQVPLDSDEAGTGRRIYLEGKFPDGQGLYGMRPGVGPVSGAAAACVNCHRPSGLGGAEGTIAIPPITGRALFGGGAPVIVRMDKQFDPGLSVPQDPYDEKSFASAVRLGQHRSGRALHALMPRYAFSDAQLRAVSAYLKTLSTDLSPGVVGDTIQLATVIAPDVDPQRRQALISTLTTVVNQMNINVKINGRRQKAVAVDERRLNSRRKWALDIWELTGPSSSWGEQLKRRHLAKPVFALVSGLARDEWQPVHDFCESHRVACWFPSVDLAPVGASQGRFSLYFSAGIALEAEVIARKLIAYGGRVVQVVGADPVARGAAAAMRRAAPAELAVLDVDFSDELDAIRPMLSSLKSQDTLVLWLRPSELEWLTAATASAASIFVSATLSGAEQVQLPTAWRKNATLVQPLEEPRLRAANLERLEAWMKGSGVPVLDRKLQSEVFFAAASLQSTLRGMLNNLHTDYLIERAETTLSSFELMQVQDEVQAMMMGPMNKRPLPLTLPSQAEVAAMAALSQAQREHLEEMRQRGGTTVYPRLSLAQGQRFASKGAYLIPLSPNDKTAIGQPEWVVP